MTTELDHPYFQISEVPSAFSDNRVIFHCLCPRSNLLKGMRDLQVFFTLFITTPFLLISVIGETFVIISGGIDLSVSGVIALTTTASAA